MFEGGHLQIWRRAVLGVISREEEMIFKVLYPEMTASKTRFRLCCVTCCPPWVGDDDTQCQVSSPEMTEWFLGCVSRDDGLFSMVLSLKLLVIGGFVCCEVSSPEMMAWKTRYRLCRLSVLSRLEMVVCGFWYHLQ